MGDEQKNKVFIFVSLPEFLQLKLLLLYSIYKLPDEK